MDWRRELLMAAALLVGAAQGCGGGIPAAATTGATKTDAAATAAPHADAAVDAAEAAVAKGGAPGCVPSGPEVCDGKDNDCDGVVDNGFTYQGSPVGGACYPGVGACIDKGVVVCASSSAAGCSTSAGSPDDSYHTVAASNGSWDWNCNNNVDRKYPLAACESFSAGTCPAQGWSARPGETGDCGQMLLQQSCAATSAGCVSTGAGTLVAEGCK